MKRIFIIIGIITLAVFIFQQLNSPIALSCVHKEEDKNWSFLSFYNTCNSAINVVFCNKSSLGEIGSLFGYDTGKWSCQRHHAVSRQSITTIKWVNEQSSVASHLMSTSQYRVAACKAPYSPRFTDDTTYNCEKP